MKLIPQTPKKALNKAFLKQRPLRAEMDLFKQNLISLLGKIDEIEHEENQKNHVRDFLLNTYYKNTNEINTKGVQDLVIHNGKDSKTSVGVIIEAKRPNNKAEWISTEKPNGKALQELVLYYLRERIEENNIDIKYLVATNINEWYIFEASYFEKTFYQNRKLVKEYEQWRDGQKVTKDTKLFYNEIAKPFIDSLEIDAECTFFNINDYETALKNESLEDDKNLIALLKILSPNHLLKVPFANDSNSLDKVFYAELLHIIGLTEVKDGGKKLIQRQPEGNRNEGSLLENAIMQLESHDKILRLENPSQYGATHQERLFNVGLELVITWMNRILFLKLLEAQLLTYHKGDKNYAFLNLEKIKDYDELDKLFFRVLAKKVEDRDAKINELFGLIPYLNSSLFEPTELEHQTLFINALGGSLAMPFLSSSILTKDKKRKDSLNGIAYLFEFLNAYDFSSDGSGDIQEDNKRLINASVLGLIFEKINGYKDGSFFTPGFITMYMCRETIRRSVVQKFTEHLTFQGFKTLEELTKIEDIYELIPSKISRKQANEVINSLKICDPAVGSGHFLVSALNELIAIKSDLKILEDKTGKSLNRYDIAVINDELVVADEDGELFDYNPNNKESQRIQETLFHEKQTLIENCLFGVDINPNSVKICRLRLWVELLKNGYYRHDNKQLETLPNIDINIKCGNSLISRFALNADLKQALKKSKWNVESYQLAVQTYRHAQSKEEKWEMERLIKDIKSDFRTEINKNDPKLGKLHKLEGELTALTTQTGLFEMTPKDKKIFDKKVKNFSTEITKLETEIEEIKSNRIYENAFEWRFEFPEVLNNDGDFVGFDVVIGNPPYFSISKLDNSALNYFSNSTYQTFIKSTDIYCLFLELAKNIGSSFGINHFIVSNKWLTAGYGQKTRIFLAEHTSCIFIIDFNKFQIFDEAAVDACLISYSNKNGKRADYLEYDIKDKSETVIEFLDTITSSIKTINLLNTWNLGGFEHQAIKEKIERKGKILNSWDVQFYRGITTGFNEAFVIDKATKNKLINEDKKNAAIIKPLLRGRDIKKYGFEKSNLSLIFTQRGFDDAKNSSVINHLIKYKEQLLPKASATSIGRKSGNYKWFEIQDVSIYAKEFEKEKLIFTKASKIQAFAYDDKGYFVLNTSYIMVGEKLKYLLALLNSKLFQFVFKNFYQSGGIDGEITIQAIEKIPIVYPTEKKESKINKVVQKIILLKDKNLLHHTSALEKEINELVYELYGLTQEEIKIVENESK